MEFSVLKGKILSKIDVSDDEIYFYTTDNKKYRMYHEQDCCESVYIEDIIGIPIMDLIGDEILLAEERTNDSENTKKAGKWIDENFTWTFYELATIKGAVTIRWYGTSNGYYSESVDFEEIR